jgi:hypothetical protein
MLYLLEVVLLGGVFLLLYALLHKYLSNNRNGDQK